MVVGAEHEFSIVAFGSLTSTSFNFVEATTCISCPYCESNGILCESNKKWRCPLDETHGH